MARSSYSTSHARSALPQMIREAEKRGVVAIARRGQTVAYLISREHLDAIVETMGLLANLKASRAIRNHRAGRTRFHPVTALDDK
jgi:prevent-host-death family protein